ncbi:MAG: TonB-dependent receptor [Gemmatimonadota bacterium]
MRRSVRQGWLLGVLAGALALVAFAPGAATAQTSTGSIRGHVLDENGETLTGASVVATHTATNFQRGMLTEEGGFYNLSGLPVGEYAVEYSHPSYGAQTQNVRVQIGQSLSLDVVLFTDAIEVAGITAVIEQERIIEATTPEVATNITEAQIDNLPLLNRDFLKFAELVPGVLPSRDGNSIEAGGLPAENINLFIDGASYKSEVLQEGIVGQDASAGNPFPQNAVEEFRVITQNYKAEFQKAAGAVVTATTKSGTNRWEVSGFFLGQNENLIAEDAFQKCEAPGQAADCVQTDVNEVGRQQFGGTIGGPLVRDKLFVFGSFEGNYRDLPENVQTVSAEDLAKVPESIAGIPARDLVALAEGSISDRELRSNLFFGKLTYSPADRHRFETSLNVRDEFEVRSFGGFLARSHAEDFNIDVLTALGKYQYSNDRLLNEAFIDFQRFRWNPTPLNPDTPGLVFDGILRVGGRSTEQDIFQDKWELRDDLTYTLPDWGGSHVFKTGTYLSFSNYDITTFLNGNPQFTFREQENFAFPFRAEVGVGDPQFDSDNTQFGIYAQDDWSPTDRLILNFGLRWDVESNMLNNDWVTPDSVIEDVSPFLTPEQEAQYFTDGGDRDPFYGALAPRVGFTYDLTGGHRTTLFGGFGLFYDRTRFGLGSSEITRLTFPNFQFLFSEDGLPDENGRPTIAWDDRFLSREGLLSIVESGSPTGKPEVFLLENDVKPPVAQQWTIGLRQAVGPLMLSANYTGVRGDHVFTWIFGNRNPDGSLFQTPRFRNILLSTDEGETWYDALQLQAGKPFNLESGWGLQVAYTLGEAEQNTFGDFTLDVFSPADFPRHPSSNDIRHNLTMNWILGLPWDIRFNGIAAFRSARPISARVPGDPNGNGIGGDDFPAGETRNSRRPEEGDFAEVNIRFEKGIEFATGQRIAVLAEIFNQFNTENWDGFRTEFGTFDPATGQITRRDDFGQPTSLDNDNPSRRLQLGVRYGF